MSRNILYVAVLVIAGALLILSQRPQLAGEKVTLPNGWRITPVGRAIPTEDLIMNIVPSPDGKALIANHCGYNPHGLLVMDARSEEAIQRIPLESAYLGLAWHPGGKRLFISGGHERKGKRSPIYVFDYNDGRLSKEPVAQWQAPATDAGMVSWSGLVHHPKKNILYAADRGAGDRPSFVYAFDSDSGKVVGQLPAEKIPYDLVISPDGRELYVSNWGSDTISVLDTEAGTVRAIISACDNPNDLLLARDGRLFAACANDNSVIAIDTKTRRRTERILTSLYPGDPEGSTPNALALDKDEKTLFVANADNNSVAVVSIVEPGESAVQGFIPAGWYPSALAVSQDGRSLYIGNGKGLKSSPNPEGPPGPRWRRGVNVMSLVKGSVNVVPLTEVRRRLKEFTKQVYANTPYTSELLTRAAAPNSATIIPRDVGAGSPIEHVIYIIKENRTYDQVLGALGKGNGDPTLTIFGRNVTPNHHAIAEQFVLFDNLYCDSEVSVDGHQWSNAAYATDYIEKNWPYRYGGHSDNPPAYARSEAVVPTSGYLWDQCARKGLTYRSYGEFARRTSEGTEFEATPASRGLIGHFAPNFKKPGYRDTDNAREFILEFDQYEKNFESRDAEKRLPNFIVMSLGENHTRGTTPGACTPVACVASNDLALGMIVERVTHSKYWPQTAIFVIEDDAQNGPDHVDGRRTVGLVVSPYIKRGIVDSTLYTTSSMLRTIELLLGLQPMSQYDAAATPMYAAFGVTADLTPFKKLPAQVDLNAKNSARAWGARESLAMDFSDYDRAPEFELNEIVWKSVKGLDSPMPLPVRSYHFQREFVGQLAPQ